MKTAVQLRTRLEIPSAHVVGGVPEETVVGQRGDVALFAGDAVVAYLLRTRRRKARCFVFRTLAVDDRLAAKIPGAQPRVRLLGQVPTLGRAELVERLFVYLAKEGRDPSALPDAFYVRVMTALGGRLPSRKVLRSFLEPTSSPIGDSPWTF